MNNVSTLASAQTLKGSNWCEQFFKTGIKYEVFTQNHDDEVMM